MKSTGTRKQHSIRFGPGTAGVVQRIDVAKEPIPQLKVMKPIVEQPCSINQY
jgi:hypothetical protein